jgi:hypothetical protein
MMKLADQALEGAPGDPAILRALADAIATIAANGRD